MGLGKFWRRFVTRKARPASAKKARRVPVQLRLEALEERTLLASNAIVTENALAGTPQSQWDIAGAGDPALQGFATNMSVNVGQVVSFKIKDTPLAPYHIDIYRM